MKNLVYDMATVSASKIIAQTDSGKNQYGLTTPEATVDMATTDGKTYTLYLGSKSPLSDGYYAMIKGDSKIYLLTLTAGDDLMSSSQSLIDLSLSALDSAKLNLLTNITFGGASRTQPIKLAIDAASASSYTASQDENGNALVPQYNIVSPGSYNTNSTNLSSLVNSLISLNASDIVSLDISDKSLSSYGLSKPAYTFTYTYNKKDYSYSFGNTFTKDTTQYIYVTETGKNAVYDVPVASVSFYNYQLMDVGPDLLYSPQQIDSVKSVTVTNGTTTWKYDLTGTDSSKNLKVTSGSKTLDVAQFRNLYEQLCYIEPGGVASTTSTSKLVCKITFEFRDSSKKNDVLEFTTLPDANDASQVDAYRTAILVNGNSSFYIKTAFINNILKYSQDIVNGKTVPQP
jgi:hypothetical protein